MRRLRLWFRRRDFNRAPALTRHAMQEFLAEIDAKMIRELNFKNYFKFILQTVAGKGSGDRVKGA